MNALAVSEAAYAAHELGPHAAAATASSVAAAANNGSGGNKRGGLGDGNETSGDRGLVGVVALQPSLPHVRHRYVLALTGDGRTLVVGFAGTTDARDLWADVNLLQDALPDWEPSDDDDDDDDGDGETDQVEGRRSREDNGRFSSSSPAAHRGFLERAAAVPIEQLAEHAASELAGCERLLLCGHSLGGAVAQLATLRLLLLRDREEKEQSRRRRRKNGQYPSSPSRHLPVSCVAFAPPALGNAALAHLVERKKWRPLFYSLTYQDDPVPRMLAEIDAGLRQRGGGGAAAASAADAAGALEASAANDDEASSAAAADAAAAAAPAVVSHTPLTAKEDDIASSPAPSSRWSVPATTAAASKAAAAVAGAVAGAARSAAAAAAARLPAMPSYTHLGTHHSPELLAGKEAGGGGVGGGGGGREGGEAGPAVAVAASPREERKKKRDKGAGGATPTSTAASTATTAATAAASRLAALAASALPSVSLPPSLLPAALLGDLALPTFSLRVPSLTPHRLSTYRDRLLAISARAWGEGRRRKGGGGGEEGEDEVGGATPFSPSPSPSSDAVRLSTTLAPPLVAAVASARMPPLPPLAATARDPARNGSSGLAGGGAPSTAAAAEAAAPSSYWSAVRRGAARAVSGGGGAAVPAAAAVATTKAAASGATAAAAAAAAASMVALRIAVRGSGLSSVRGARLRALGSWTAATAVSSAPAHRPPSSSSSHLSVIARLPLATARAAAAATGTAKAGEQSDDEGTSRTPLTLWLRSDFREAALPVALRLPSVWLLGSPPGAEAGALRALAAADGRRGRGGSGVVVSSDGVAVVPAASAASAGQRGNEGGTTEASPSLPPPVPFQDQVAAACASMENFDGDEGEEEHEMRGSRSPLGSSLLQWWRKLGTGPSSALSSPSSPFPPPDALFVVHGAPLLSSPSRSRRSAGDRRALARLAEAAASRGIRVVPVVAAAGEGGGGEGATSSDDAGRALAECYSGPSFSPSVVALPPAVLPREAPSSSSTAALLSSLFRRELLRREVATGASPSSRL